MVVGGRWGRELGMGEGGSREGVVAGGNDSGDGGKK